MLFTPAAISDIAIFFMNVWGWFARDAYRDIIPTLLRSADPARDTKALDRWYCRKETVDFLGVRTRAERRVER